MLFAGVSVSPVLRKERDSTSISTALQGGWRCSYALCNMYQDGQEGVGPHAGKAAASALLQPLVGFVILF